MRKIVAKMLFAGAAAAAAIGLSATSALAATWTVTGGPNYTGLAGTTTLTVHHGSSNVTLTCQSSRAAGDVTDGSGQLGPNIGRISSISFTNCTLGGILSFTVTAGHLPWTINAVSFASPVTNGTITGIHASISGTGCTAVVDGTAATANNGSVNGTYNNTSRVLAVSGTGGNLHVYNVSGCLGLIASGDAANFAGNYTITGSPTNPIQITSP